MELSNQQDVILVYTRQPVNDYTESLANSVHLALRQGEGELQAGEREVHPALTACTIQVVVQPQP